MIAPLIASIANYTSLPVYSFDSNVTRELPCVIVGIEGEERHPVLDASTLRVSVSIYSNGHVTENPKAELESILTELTLEDTGALSASYEGTDTTETESATIHTANFTLIF